MVRRKKQIKNTTMRYLITKLSPRSSISEQYRTVRTNIQFSSVGEDVKTILVTSASPGEGKSMTAANLAVVYAQQGKSVLLIDADLRKPTVHYTFRVDNSRGLSNILAGGATLVEAVITSEVENLNILTSGPIPPNPSELLASKRMNALIEEARHFYDIILFDTPPILVVTDAQILANICDGSVLVVRSKCTEFDPAQKAIEVLNAAEGKILGAILNDSDKKESDYYN
ncbi:CpsD/CapB family tyrosine-protein kinase [Bacillus sp. sid0103]|uniref:CpsD/CapB family tyrosine-protein kinase n=1 Tax=Bacillus sp. sid0103 TaxID=2856337 RepID=UPI001C481284|nr:CpsD/CapB family tyrosine-protein kinase [Bacillus sp. sid0103]MBV7505579.1 CpsD/CapB family tyrosine-protein kinase [Bacillus sp. sid0103]